MSTQNPRKSLSFSNSDAQIIEQFKASFLDNDEEYDEFGDENSQKIEFKTQLFRIAHIMDDMMQSIETVLCMRHILQKENADEILQPYFIEEHIDHIKMIFIRDKLATTNIDFTSFNDIEFTNIMDLITLSGFTKELVKYKAEIPEFQTLFLSNLSNLRKIADIMSVGKEISKEKALDEMWRANNKTKSEINVLRAELSDRVKISERNQKEKREAIEKKKEELANMKNECDEFVLEKINHFNKIMVGVCAESRREQDILKTDSERASHDLQTLITSNLTEYRILRNNKTKLTQQLQYWIAKYDDDVGVRTEEIGQLKAKLKDLTDDFEKWQAETYDPQLEQYTTLMQEKDDEEKRRQEEAQLWFAMNRAARVLQKYWRMVAARKKMKKGKGKGKKGKKK